MSQLILNIVTRARVARYSVADAITASAHHAARRAFERVTREQTGQDMVEYAGVLLVVAIIVAAVVASPIGGDVKDAVSSLISSITNGNCPNNKQC
jgi:Flp pilus assembly pilin Flp